MPYPSISRSRIEQISLETKHGMAMSSPGRFVCGFRLSNIEIEIVKAEDLKNLGVPGSTPAEPCLICPVCPISVRLLTYEA